MVNLQSSIDELQKEYNSNYATLEELERNYQDTKKLGKRKERIERKIRYEIEKYKLQVRNQVISEGIKKLKEQKNLIISLSDQYLITENVPKNITSTELEEKVNNTEKQLMVDYEKLDIIAIQKAMAIQFYRIRSKGKRIKQILCGALLALCGGISDIVSIPILLNTVCATMLGGGILTYCVQTVINRPYKKLFQKLNAELGENALPVTYTDAHDVSLKNNLKLSQNQTVATKLELLKEKKMLELKRREEQVANEEDNKIQTVRSQTQDMAMNNQLNPASHLDSENDEKQKCMQ